MVDDVSSMFSPRSWLEFVLPYQNAFFERTTTGRRSAHIEDLKPDHLLFLEDLQLSRIDPSISGHISPPDIRDRCRVAFGWRLGSFHYHTMSCQNVVHCVFQAAADGASSVFTYVADSMCNPETVPKVHAFITAAKEVEQMFKSGSDRADIAACVSPEGRVNFWDHWPDK